MAQKLKFVLVRVENIVVKGENAGVTSSFSFYHNAFKIKGFSYSIAESYDCVVKGSGLTYWPFQMTFDKTPPQQ